MLTKLLLKKAYGNVKILTERKPDIIDNGFVIVNFKNGVRGLLDLCMFAENSDMQEELVAVGDIGKIETSVPSSQSGKTSSYIRIGMRKGNKTTRELVKVDKKIQCCPMDGAMI